MAKGKHFEDFAVGDRFESIGRTVRESDLTTFVGLSGMFEELFIDETYLKTTLFDRPFVPALLTLSMAEGLNILLGLITGTGLALVNLEFRSTAPVFVGDTIKNIVEVAAARPTKDSSRGLVTFRHTVTNQDGKAVLEYTAIRVIRACAGKAG